MSGLPPVQIPQPLMSPVPGIGGAGGNYVPAVSFNWDSLPGKPATFPPSAHTHSVGDISGLSGTLSGLQTQIDGKQPLGSYVTTTNFTWANLADKPTSFTPSAHTHTFAEIPGLQAALDGKQAAGSYASASHTHIIANVTGLQDALNDKVTRSNTGVRFGVLPYKAALWVNDGSDGTGIGGWARSFAIQAGSNSTHGGFFTAYGGDTQAAEVRIGVGTVDTSYTQSNALCISSTGMTWANNTVWHGGNFNPASKADVGHTHNSTTGDHTVSGNLYLGNTDGSNLNAFRLDVYANDLAIVASSGAGAPAGASISFRTATAGGGETERMRINPDGIVGLSVGLTVQGNPVWHSGNFDPNSKLDLTGGTLSGLLIANGGIWNTRIGYNPNADYFSVGTTTAANYGMSLGEHGASGSGLATMLSGYSGLRLATRAATRLAITTGGNVGIGVDGSGNDSALRVVSPSGAGFRVGFNGSAENYYDAGYHAMRHTTGAPILEMYPSTIYARQDLYATSGNIFVRENPSGAGAGMRLHHSGGGAYIDYDGNLNFRNGEGGGIASLNSDGAFIANNVVGTEQLRVGGYTSATGFMNFSNGSGSYAGYAAWYTPDGTRRGYLGWGDGAGNLVFQGEAGYGLRMSIATIFGSATSFDANATFNAFAQFKSSGNPQSSANPSLQAYAADGSSGAWMAFHRPGVYAINMGLDSSNVFRIGGWSAGNIFSMDMSGNLTLAGGITTQSTNNLGGQVNIAGGNLRINSHDTDSNMGAYIGFRNPVNGERGWIGFGENTTRMRVRNAIGDIWVHGTTVTLYSDNSGGQTRIGNDVGNTYIGSVNSSWSHFSTDRPAFYFAQPVHFDNAPMRYQQGALLHHDSGSMASGKITTSTSAPSGGSDGDIWLKVT